MPKDVMATTAIVQDIMTTINTKDMTDMVNAILTSTMAGIADVISTEADTIDMIMVRLDIERRASVLVLVDMKTAFVMAMGAGKVSSKGPGSHLDL